MPLVSARGFLKVSNPTPLNQITKAKWRNWLDAIPKEVIGGKYGDCKRTGLTTRKRSSRAGSNPALATKSKKHREKRL